MGSFSSSFLMLSQYVEPPLLVDSKHHALLIEVGLVLCGSKVITLQNHPRGFRQLGFLGWLG